ncbi:alkaline phosphatase D family protein [Caulobacter sp.]|uniref:alkaline phosphatase D family protein n=1 Tax=Caulobacter sp. TaxID=78 RepID=UPI003BABB5C3
MTIARRALLQAGGLVLVTGLSAGPVWSQGLGADPFTLGVASGDPAPDGFVIWTRLANRPLEFGGGMPMRAIPVRWEVSADEGFTRIVASGETLARPELGHSVHVEIGGLKSATRYWYRFFAAAETSRVGTARSAPEAGAQADRLRIGVAGCQHYEAGLYTAYRHLSEESDLDAIFHYGDYIYEGAAGKGCPVAWGSADKGRVCFRKHVGEELYSLDDYRRRYAQYKTDPDLQAAHAAAAFIVSFDDHEVDNNWAGDDDQDATPREVFRLRRAAALQAWYENMPVRRAQFPAGGHVRMHRRIDYGDLLRLHVLDTRQYRSGQICGAKAPDGCLPLNDPSRPSILGEGQSVWLEEGLGGEARWNLLAQQVMVMPLAYPAKGMTGGANTDSWSGYPASRERLVAAIQSRGLTNVVIATGDVHQHHAGVLPARAGALDSAAVATEFVASSISSGSDGFIMAEDWKDVPANNPHCQLFDARRGYQIFNVGRDIWRTEVKVVDKVTAPGGALSTVAQLVVDRRRPGFSFA